MTFWSFASYSNFPTDKTFQQFHDFDTWFDLHKNYERFSMEL